jgi:hypothetical protein
VIAVPATSEERRSGPRVGPVSATEAPQRSGRPAGLLVTRDLAPAYAVSPLVAALVAVVSAAGLAFPSTGLYGADPPLARGIAVSAAGILVPGFVAHDVFNLAVALPLLLGTLWLARRGSRTGLLLWPGVLFYVLYTYNTYLLGAPFGPLFLAHVLLVVLSASTVIGLVASVDGEAVRALLAGAVPARTGGAVLVGLALLTLGQDAGGAVATALGGGATPEPLARHVWTADLVLEVPAVLAGGVLLWRRHPLGYTVGAGLLFQFALTPVALASIMALQPWLTGAPVDAGTIAGVLAFAAVPSASLAFFVRAAERPPVAAPLPDGSEPLAGAARGGSGTVSSQTNRAAHLPSLLVALLMAIASTAGILGAPLGVYGGDPAVVAVFVGQDAANLVVGLPALLGGVWLASRGGLVGALLRPGALFYVLYTYALYVVGAPFGALFLLHVGLAVLSAYATIVTVASIDGEEVRRRLARAPARAVGAVVVGVGALATVGLAALVVPALSDPGSVDPLLHARWIVDFAVGNPVLLVGGVLLWRRTGLGYAAGAGLLFLSGVNGAAFGVGGVLGAFLTATPLDAAVSAVHAAIAAVCLALLVLFLRGADRPLTPSPG